MSKLACLYCTTDVGAYNKLLGRAGVGNYLLPNTSGHTPHWISSKALSQLCLGCRNSSHLTSIIINVLSTHKRLHVIQPTWGGHTTTWPVCHAPSICTPPGGWKWTAMNFNNNRQWIHKDNTFSPFRHKWLWQLILQHCMQSVFRDGVWTTSKTNKR